MHSPHSFDPRILCLVASFADANILSRQDENSTIQDVSRGKRLTAARNPLTNLLGVNPLYSPIGG